MEEKPKGIKFSNGQVFPKREYIAAFIAERTVVEIEGETILPQMKVRRSQLNL